jgi:uncharacterized protein (TIGR03083 family)
MPIDHVAHLRREADTLAEVVRTAPLDAPVPACPGWDLARLVRHVGRIYRSTALTTRTGMQPAREDVPLPPEDADEVPAWFAESADIVVASFDGLDLDAPSWNPFGAPGGMGFWPRRMALETMVHRWDAEEAAGRTTALDPELAADGVLEALQVYLSLQVARSDVPAPSGTLHLHATDTPGEWTLRGEDGRLVVDVGHAKGDAAARGTAEDLLLVLWGRRPLDQSGIEVFGDRAVFDAWMAYGMP